MIFPKHPVVHKALNSLQLTKNHCNCEKINLETTDCLTIGIHGVIYDVTEFQKKHPGGSIIFLLNNGLDATSLYESVHVNMVHVEKTLADIPRLGTYRMPIKFSYKRYSSLRETVFTIFPTRKSRSMSWLSFMNLLLLCLLTLSVHCLLWTFSFGSIYWCTCIVVSALLNSICGGYGHSSLHKFHWTSILLDWNGLSTFEWMMEHVVSHHPHVNTDRDHDAISMEPFLAWLPHRQALLGNAQTSWWLHLIHLVSELVVAMQGLFIHRFRWYPLIFTKEKAWIRFAPFLFIFRVLSHIIYHKTFFEASITFLSVFLLSGFYFSTLAHMNHNNVSLQKEEEDFLVHQIANTRDLPVGGPLTLFLDRQQVHHLFPSIDHTRWTSQNRRLVLKNIKHS